MNVAMYSKYERQVIEAGTTIFREKELGEAMYVIARGRVRISKHVVEGVEKTLSILEEGEYFGEMSLLLNAPRSATATALEETELITLGRDDFKQMLREYPQAGMAMLIQLSNRLEKANQEAILLALELALIEHSPHKYAAVGTPGGYTVIAVGSFDLKEMKEVLRCRKELHWNNQTSVLASLLTPGQGQNALTYIFQTTDARETLKLAACFKNLVQWRISLAVSTDDDILDTLPEM